MSIFSHDSYRSFLQAELAERMQRNPKYSLRAMARALGLASSTLSEVINGRANFSTSTAHRVALALNLKDQETTYLCDLVQLESTRDPETRQMLTDRLRRNYPKHRVASNLALDQFEQMSNWYHMAMLELPHLRGFKFTAENVAKTLGITKPSAQLAIERLKRLDLIEVEPSGVARRKSPHLKVSSPVKHQAMRKYYRQMLAKIETALSEQTPQERLSGYLNVAIDPKLLPEIDAAIDRFFLDIRDIAGRSTERTKVYHLSLHFINSLTSGANKS